VATILVIEDNLAFRDLLRLHLRQAGHTVETAADPEEGLRSLINTPPDLILLDLDLPYLSGFEVLEALRSDPASQKIPVIIVTGNADEEVNDRCRTIGIEGFLTKPFKGEHLIQAIAKALAARGEK
jgi:two-component system phosphate regulon response regulator PhoB